VNEVIEKLVAAVNNHQLDEMVALFHPDYDSRQPAHSGEAFVGRDQVRANWASMFAGVPDFHGEIVTSADDRNTTWCEWHWTGTRTDGQPFDVRGVTLFEVREGRIAAGTLYMEEVEAETRIDQAVQKFSGRPPDESA
jgi:ketosteroid isomerase-like protein